MGNIFERVLADPPPVPSEVVQEWVDRGLIPPSTSTSMTDLRFMAGMRPTAEIEAELRERKERGEVSGGMIQMLEKHLEKGRIRDEIQATRPEGCWCVGYGSKGTLSGRQEYCSCPEGRAVREQMLREQRERNLEAQRLRWERAEVPARFTSYTLENFPATERTQRAYDAVQLWVYGPGIDEDLEGGAYEAALDTYRDWEKKRNDSLLLFGPFGTGKTGLAVGALRELVERHGAGMFLTVPNLLDRIRSSYGEKGDGDRELLDKVLETPVLMLDDIGAERVTEWVAEKLFTIINTRHDNLLPTIFTSNLDPKQLAGHVGERTAWRIIEMCEVIRLDGPNLRDRRG